ncbi:MAG TPA: hypothetical protein DCY20_00635 [Firmicutes bacterium]|nr:hypothetical protein [Bacillota bacterium]
MKHYSQHVVKKATANLNVEFGSEFGELSPKSNRDYNIGDMPSSVGGAITRNLVAMGERMLVENNKK